MTSSTGRSTALHGAHLIVGYDQTLSTEMTNEILSHLARLHLDRLTLAGWLAAGDYIASCISGNCLPALCLYDPDVLDLQAADQYHIRQALAFFGKRKDLNIGVDREATALAKFREAEHRCKVTNDCFRAWSQGRFQFRPEVERVLHAAQLKISKVLGSCPEVRAIRPRFGPGASTQVPKRNACVAVKLRHAPKCSANLAATASFPEGEGDFLAEALGSLPEFTGEKDGMVNVEIDVARLSFVPKNAKTDRAICTEPQLNGLYQLGIGDYIADRLRTVGIDIRDQSANQRAALYASISGESATLDLSSASDTVATKLIEHLLPEDWYSLLSRFRSAEVMVKDELLVMEKISSMGNGFTFALETLVFWALALSAKEIYSPHARHRVLVYGDDIVVPQGTAVPLMAILRDLGFVPNPSKSFWEGSFRESCGKDYVVGTDVRPVYVDDALTGADFFRLHNYYYGRKFFDFAAVVERWIHPSIRTRGPQGFGDGHLHSNVWVATPVRPDRGWSGFAFETWTFSVKHLKRELAGRLASVEKRKRISYGPKGLREQSVRMLTWHPRALHLVRRLATYVQYLREPDSEEFGPHRPYSDKYMPRESSGDDLMKHLVVPGAGQVHRTKVYTFEPPRLH